MLVSAAELPSPVTLESDICIIGGGPAGITTALSFEGLPLRVILLEGGRLKYDRAGQALYKGMNVGITYDRLDLARSRFLGGSSNCWAGFCRPLDAHDFQARDWVPNSGWPISKSDLDVYFEHAHELLELGPLNYSPDIWEAWINRPDARLLKFQRPRAINLIAQVSPPTRFGQRYRDALARSSNTSVFLDASVTEIETSWNGGIVAKVRGKTLAGGDIQVAANFYVLAAGGIETARLMLASNRQQPAGVGNAHGVVGRYFMDHPRLTSGSIVFRDASQHSRIYDMHSTFARRFKKRGVRLNGFFGLTPQVQRAERIGNTRCCVKSHFIGHGPESYSAMLLLLRTIGERWPLRDRSAEEIRKILRYLPNIAIMTVGLTTSMPLLGRSFALETVVEPTPLPDSRVVLTEERDALGVQRVQVDWQLGELEKRTIRRTQQILAEELAPTGDARVIVDAPADTDPWPSTLAGCWHHMGTARMHSDSRKGVVDANCRVHGIANLFIAGSAVFPTAGSDAPTINIIALALRLAEHLKTLHGLRGDAPRRREGAPGVW